MGCGQSSGLDKDLDGEMIDNKPIIPQKIEKKIKKGSNKKIRLPKFNFRKSVDQHEVEMDINVEETGQKKGDKCENDNDEEILEAGVDVIENVYVCKQVTEIDGGGSEIKVQSVQGEIDKITDDLENITEIEKSDEPEERNPKDTDNMGTNLKNINELTRDDGQVEIDEDEMDKITDDLKQINERRINHKLAAQKALRQTMLKQKMSRWPTVEEEAEALLQPTEGNNYKDEWPSGDIFTHEIIYTEHTLILEHPDQGSIQLHKHW